MTDRFFYSIIMTFYGTLLSCLSCQANCCGENPYRPQRPHSALRVCFYNVENFFDTIDDPHTDDDAFTPEGANHWTSVRMHVKAQHIAKTIIAMGGMQAPEIVGVCEIENAIVIQKLLYHTPLKKIEYNYVHFPSPDRRGISTALLYREAAFRVLYAMPVKVQDASDSTFRTRDILYVKGVPTQFPKDTLHLFVNHWTSRYGGYAATVSKRNSAAQILRFQVDSLLDCNQNAKILIMGDFNDYPCEESISIYLNAPCRAVRSDGRSLVNMMYPYLKQNNKGTHKHGQEWGILDQIIVSQSLFSEGKGIRVLSPCVIFDADFLLTADDEGMNSKKPFRTYQFIRYLGGFSDHLPIFIDLGKE
jgi:predicted extracellular nuclease